MLAVCGLAFEQRIAAGGAMRTVAGGGDRARLAVAIEREIDAGATAVVSFGLAGALVPSLAAGRLVIADRVVDDDGWVEPERRWRDALAARLPGAAVGTFAGSDRLVATSADKRALHDATRAIVVDLESHVAARVAVSRRVPFAALRAVSDPLDRPLPPAATVAMRDDGTVDRAAVLRSVLLGPGQIPTLIRIGIDTGRALRGLDRARRLLGDRLGLPDLDQLLLDVP